MKRGTRFLFLLLVAANAQKVIENISNGDLKRQLNQIENGQTFDNFRIKSVMDRILQSVDANNKKMEDLMMKVQSIKERDCQRTLAAWSLSERNATMFFKAMGRTFYYNTTNGTWNETRDWCSSRGMHLATLKTAEEMKQVKYELKSKISSTWDKSFWVSASDVGRSPGQFHWADGTPVLKSTWLSGQPDNHYANQETCTIIYTGGEKLRDLPCSHPVYTLCEVPEPLATCL